MNAEKYNLDRIYFGGCFIRGKDGRSFFLCEVTDHRNSCRTCGHNHYIIVCYPILEQGNEACTIPSA